VTAASGLSAASTAGDRTIPITPSAPATTNQTSITGPNMPPIRDVPLRWTRNRMARMTTVSGTTAWLS
jgi:hypothetical protein